MDITQQKPTDLELAQSKSALIAVSPVVSIHSALGLMKSHHITSIPIFSHNDTRVVSIINLFDILVYLVNSSRGGDRALQKSSLPLLDPVENVLGLDTERESYRMHKTETGDKLLDTLRAFASGRHRSLVVDPCDETKNPWLLSQTDIIRHIDSHPECIRPLVNINASLRDLGLATKPLITVPQTEPTLDVLRAMAEHSLSGVPIVDSNGSLLGDICVEDLPGTNLDRVDDLTLSCTEYLEKTGAGTPPIAGPDTDLQHIIKTMVQYDTHRVWIVDQSTADKKVIGVITMSDIIRLLCQSSSTSLF